MTTIIKPITRRTALIGIASGVAKLTVPSKVFGAEIVSPRSVSDSVTELTNWVSPPIQLLPWQKSFVEMLVRAKSAGHGLSLDMPRSTISRRYPRVAPIRGTTYNSYISSATLEKEIEHES